MISLFLSSFFFSLSLFSFPYSFFRFLLNLIYSGTGCYTNRRSNTHTWCYSNSTSSFILFLPFLDSFFRFLSTYLFVPAPVATPTDTPTPTPGVTPTPTPSIVPTPTPASVEDNTGAIVGGVIGGIIGFLLIVIILIALFLSLMKDQAAHEEAARNMSEVMVVDHGDEAGQSLEGTTGTTASQVELQSHD